MTLPADEPRFASWLMGGFESATMQFSDGRSVSVAALSRHDRMAAAEFRLLRDVGIATVRDAIPWNLVERTPLAYDWSPVLPRIQAAAATGTQVVWDLCHFGYPAWLDPWGAAFVDRFAAYAHACARLVAGISDCVPIWAPVNEISFWSFAAGEHAHFAPLGQRRGSEWKRQLVRASLAAIAAVREVDPRARILHTDPIIHVIAREPANADRAETARLAQFEAWDMLCGRAEPELGGSIAALDLVGVNYYGTNQWLVEGGRLPLGGLYYRPLSTMLQEVWQRYGRPVVVSETGAEEPNGVGWLHYARSEVRRAMAAGVPVLGYCIYPVMDYPGWEDDRHCPCGPIEIAPGWGERKLRPHFAEALALEMQIDRWLAERRPSA